MTPVYFIDACLLCLDIPGIAYKNSAALRQLTNGYTGNNRSLMSLRAYELPWRLSVFK